MATTADIPRLEMLQVADMVAREKGIEREEVLEAMEQAIQKAGRAKYGLEHDIRAEIDRKTGEIKLLRYMQVADPIENENVQVTVAEAQRLASDSLLRVLLVKGGVVQKISSTTRSIPPRLKQAIVDRDRTCVVPGCHVAYGLEIDPRRPVHTLSVGEMQRVELIRALLTQPKILILDEPTSGLDPHATHELLEMIRDLKKAGVAVLLSSHLLDRVQSVCDRVALFNKGKIALMGTVVELANQVLGAGHPLLVEASGVDVASTLKSIEGVQQVVDTGQGAWRVVADRDVRAAAAQHIIAAGGSLTRLAELQPSLEEVYTRYFQEQRHAA